MSDTRPTPSRPPFPTPPTRVHELLHVGVTGTNGKTSTTRLVATALGTLVKPVASITTVGWYLDDEPGEAKRSFAGMLDLVGETRRRGGKYAALEATSEVLALG